MLGVLTIGKAQSGGISADITNTTISENCNTGKIDLHVSGGFEPYEYSWIGPNGFTNFEEDISLLQNGTYCVTVTDALCGQASECYYVSCCSEISSSEVIAYCGPENKGRIKIALVNDYQNGLVYWKGPDGFIRLEYWNKKEISNLEPGRYCVGINQSYFGNSKYELCDEICFDVLDKSIKTEISDFKHNSSCEVFSDGIVLGDCTGFITLSPEQQGNIYTWTGPDGFTSNSRDISSLCPGFYVVTITNPNGCQKVIHQKICCCSIQGPQGSGDEFKCSNADNGAVIQVNPDIQNPSTANSNDGYIHLRLTQGGGFNYIVKWTGPNGFKSDNLNIDNLGPGQYCVTINDGCDVYNNCFNLRGCSEYDIQIIGTVIATCHNLQYGEIQLTPIGGTPPYKYSWSNGNTNAHIKNLGAGTYCITVTDFYKCKAVRCFEVASKPESYYYVSNPCGTQYECNGYKTRFVPAGYYFTYSGCNSQNVHCSLTNVIVDIIPLPYLSFRGNGCNIEGYCPVSRQWEVVEFGVTKREFVLVYLPSCGCYACYDVEYCINSQFYIILNSRQVNPDFCGPPPSPNSSQEIMPRELFSDLRLNEIIYSLKKDSIISPNLRNLIPVSLNDTMYLTEYSNSFDSLISRNQMIDYYLNPIEREIIDISCDDKNCGNSSSSRTKLESTIVSPNPFEDFVFVSFGYSKNDFNLIQIFDVSGNEILSEIIIPKTMKVSINTSALVPGVYYINISGSSNLLTKKIIKI